MLEGMRGYLQAAGGLTELTRKRAQELAQAVLVSTGSGSAAAMTAQVSSVAEELLGAVMANRTAVREIARAEVEAAVGRLGLVPASELSAAERTISRLEARVAELEGTGGGSRAAAATAGTSTTTGRPGRRAVKRAAGASTASSMRTTKKATAKKATAKKATAKKATAKKATAKKATAKKATAKKATAKKATAKKATAKKATAKRTTGRGRSSTAGAGS
jgi:polyhydroxyalkanoate synthesis regulator phasin